MRFFHGCFLWLLGLAIVACEAPALAQHQLIDSLKQELTRKLPDTTRANTYYDIANAFYKASQPDSALAYLKAMPPLCQRAHYWNGLGDYARLTGVVYTQRGRYEEALMSLQNANRHYTRATNVGATAKVYHQLGLLYKLMGDSQKVRVYTQQGVAYMQQAIAINQRLNATQALRGNYINLGILYEDLGEMKEGRDYFFKALAPMNNTKVLEEEARVLYNNLGKNYNVAKEYERAVDYLEKALAINLRLKRYSSLAHNYRNMATAHIGLGQPPQAVRYAELALDYLQKAKDAPLTNSVYGTLSRAYAAAGAYREAYEAQLTYKQVNDSLMSEAKTRLIGQMEGKYAVQQASELASIRAGMELARAQAVARIEAQKAAEMAAMQAGETRIIAQIKARAEVEQARAMAEMQAKYDMQKKQHQIAELALRDQQRTRQVQYMTGGLALLLVLLSMLIAQYILIRRTNRQLSVKNGIITASSEQLSKQADQLALTMKELHHRVKNNLAIVSSLLSLQANNLRDEKAIQAVRVGQQRVEAMALIHQRLYQTDSLTKINIREYLTDLAQSLMYAYGYTERDFTLVIDAEEHELDVDVAIPLGLIANELVTNAFKHAFVDKKHPWLRIGLHTENGLTLEVQDNGPGMQQGRWQQYGNWTSFGKRLVTSLSNQLNGQFEFIQHNGALFRLRIPDLHQEAA